MCKGVIGGMINVLAWLIGTLFGKCRHQRCTFPITVRPGPVVSDRFRPTGTYVVCLDCAREFPYDWDHMRVVWEAQSTETQLPEVQPEPRYGYLALGTFRWWRGLSRILRQEAGHVISH